MLHSVSLAKQLTAEGGNGVQVLQLCVDSGATSGCISKTRMDLVKVTNPQPNARIRVASGSILPVVAIGNLTLSELWGFIRSRTPATTDGTWHNMLIIDGLDPNTVLVSVRQMRE